MVLFSCLITKLNKKKKKQEKNNLRKLTVESALSLESYKLLEFDQPGAEPNGISRTHCKQQASEKRRRCTEFPLKPQTSHQMNPL